MLSDFIPVVEFADDGAFLVKLLDYLPFPRLADDFLGIFSDVLANLFLHVFVVHEHSKFECLVLYIVKLLVPFIIFLDDFGIFGWMVENVVGFDVAVNEGLLFLGELGILLIVPFLSESIKEWTLILLGLLAEASIPIGGDTETSWAASVVDSLHNVITKQDLPFLEKMTRIYEMNGLFAYGMNYAISIYGLYVCPEEAGFAYHSMPVCDSLVNKAASSGYNDIMEIADLSAHTYFYNQFYLTILNKLNQNDDFNDRDLGFPLQALGMLRDVKSRGKYSDSDLIKMFFALDAVSFFKTFCPLTVNFAYTEEQYNLNRTKIVEYATYICKLPLFDGFSPY